MIDHAAQAQADLLRLQAILSVWPSLSSYLREIRTQQLEKLVLREDNETRGRIKMIDGLLDLPDILIRKQQDVSGFP